MADALPPDSLDDRYVNIPCPSGKHLRSLVTFRNHTVATMFCLECEVAWTEPGTRAELRHIALDRTSRE
jgi:hypothetical protein